MLNPFDKVFILQIRLMRIKSDLNIIRENHIYLKISNFFKIIFFISLFIFTAMIIISSKLSKHNTPNNLNNAIIIIMIIGFLSIVIANIDYIYNIIYSLFTTLRGFIVLSFLLNAVFSFFISKIFHNSSNIILFITFFILYLVICIFSNSNIATTANTIVEILLGLISLVKIMIAFLFERLVYKDITNISTKDLASIDELEYVVTTVKQIEESWINQIDYFLLPLLIINGLALLLCTVHAYWIKEYNNGMEITRNSDLIKKYISHK